MISIPLPRKDGDVDLIIVLQAENVDRIKRNDPAELDILQYPPEVSCRKVRRIMIAYCSDEDIPKLVHLTDQRDLKGAIDFLQRGHTITPEDSDEPYRPL